MKVLGEVAGELIERGLKTGGDDFADAGVLAALREADAPPMPSFDLPKSRPGSGPVLNTPKRRKEAAEYFRRNAQARFEGARPSEVFIDDAGTAFRTDRKGRRKDGTPYYTWRNQENKNQQNSEIPAARAAAMDEIPQPDRDFYIDRSNRKADAHHIAELDRTARLFKGLNKSQKLALLKFLQKRGIEPGHTNKNRAEISKSMHKTFHAWFDKTYGSRRLNISDLSLKERYPFIQEFVSQYQAANEKLFSMRQAELKIKRNRKAKRSKKAS